MTPEGMTTATFVQCQGACLAEVDHDVCELVNHVLMVPIAQSGGKLLIGGVNAALGGCMMVALIMLVLCP